MKLSSFTKCIGSVFALLLLSSFVSAQKKPVNDKWYETNLLKNPDAEEGNPNDKVPQWHPLPPVEQWSFNVDYYGHTGGEREFDCNEKCGFPPGAGTYYFRLPVDNSNPMNALWQETDLTGIADTLAIRKINFNLGGYIAGFKCEQAGCAKGLLTIQFYDQSGKELGIFETAKDNSEMKAASEDLRMRQFEKINVSNEVPLAAAKAKITLKADSKECCNAGYIFFDNVKFSLSKGAYRTGK